MWSGAEQVDVNLREKPLCTRCIWCLIFPIWYGRQGTNFKFHMDRPVSRVLPTLLAMACVSCKLTVPSRAKLNFYDRHFLVQLCIWIHQLENEKPRQKEKFCNFSIFFYCPFWLNFIAFFNALFEFQLSWKIQFEMQVMLLTYSRDGKRKTSSLHMGQS